VTATRDPRAELDNVSEISWADRSAFGSVRGVPWWGAAVIALGVSIVSAVVDMMANGSLSTIFEGTYVIGCVAAVCLVRRRNLFGPIVQPPLVLVITVPLVVLLAKSPGGGLSSKALAVGTPLINAFPTMAIATGLTVVIGGIRLATQRRPIDADEDGPLARPRTRTGDKDRRTGSRDRGPNPARRRTSTGGSPQSAQDRGAPQDRATPPERGAPRDRTRVNPNRGRPTADPRGGQGGGGQGGGGQGGGQAGRTGGPAERGRGRGGQVPRDPRRQPPRRRNDDY
jgi:uncharacterized membrane protein YgcG